MLWCGNFVFATEISVIDDSGRQVSVNKPAQRIVSLAPHVTEMLFAIGAGDRIVATVEHSDYPPEARDIPSIGGYNLPNPEIILHYKPDLLVGWQSGNPEKVLSLLNELGYSIYLTEPRSLEQITSNLIRLGKLTQLEEQANSYAAWFQQQVNSVIEANRKKTRIGVFYQVWHDPIITLNGEHIVSEVISGCGGTNVFAKIPNLAPRVSLEAILLADPEVIVTGGMSSADPEQIKFWQQWPWLKAVKNGNVVFINPDLLQRHSPRLILGMEQLCAHLDTARNKQSSNSDHQSNPG